MRVKDDMCMEGDILHWEADPIKVENPDFSFACVELEQLENFE